MKKEKRLRTKISARLIAAISGTALMVALLFGLGGIAVHRAGALTGTAPDRFDFATTNAWYTLSDTPDVANATIGGVAVYHVGAKPTSPVNVTISFQSGTPQGGIQNHQGCGMAKFYINGGDSAGPAGSGAGPLTVQIDPSNWYGPPNSNVWTVLINDQLTGVRNGCPGAGEARDKNHVNFRASVAGTGNFIGPNGGTDFAVLQGGYCTGGGTGCPKYNYNIPFAPNCTDPTGTAVQASIYDLDDGNSLIQPTNLGVQIIDVTSGSPVAYTTTGSTGSGKRVYYHFTITQGHKYALRLIGAYTNNVLQVRIPYDSAQYQQTCNNTTNSRPPTGSINPTCDPASGWGIIQSSFSDPDGPTTATITLNGADGSTTTRPAVIPYSPSWSVQPSKVSGNWSVTLVVHNTGGGPDFTQTKASGSCTKPQCLPFSSPTMAVNQSFSFKPAVRITGTGSPAGAKFSSVSVRFGDPNGPAVFTANNVGYTGTNDLYANPAQVFTPTGPGTYYFEWTFDSNGHTNPDTLNCTVQGQAAFLPYFYVEGGNVSAGAGFGGGCSSNPDAGIQAFNNGSGGSNQYGGSATNLAALAMNDITGFASGTNGIDGSDTANVSPQSSLNFSNTISPPGTMGTLGCMPDYAGEATAPANYTEIDLDKTVDISTLSSGTYVFNNFNSDPNDLTNAGRFLITSSRLIAPGTQITLVVNSDVEIMNDIKYDPSYGTLANAPKIVIIANDGDIYLHHSVTTLTGFYVAQPLGSSGGVFYTCTNDSWKESISATEGCETALTINGGVAAGEIHLDRSYGTIGGVGLAPAEHIIFSPEIWGAALTGCTNPGAVCSTQLDSITDLPPVL